MRLPSVLAIFALIACGDICFGLTDFSAKARSLPLQHIEKQQILHNAFQALRYGEALEDPLVMIGAIAAIVKIAPRDLPEDINLEAALDRAAIFGKSDIFVVTKVDQLRDMVDNFYQYDCQWRYACQDDHQCGFSYTC